LSEFDSLLGPLVEHAQIEVYVFDAETFRFIEMNLSARENSGYSLEELQEHTPIKGLSDFTVEDFEEIVKGLKDGSEKAVHLQTQQRKKNGTSYPANVTLQLMHDHTPPVFLAMLQDVTKQHQAATELAGTQRISGVGSWQWDLLTDESRWSEQTYNIFGYGDARTTPTLERSIEHFHPDDREWILQAMQNSMQQGSPAFSEDYRIIRVDGSVRNVHAETEVTFNKQGTATLMHGTFTDITARLESEARIKKNEARLANAQRVARMGSWEWDIKANTVAWSEEAINLLGLDVEPIGPASEETLNVFHPDDRELVTKATYDSIASGKPRYSIDCRALRKDGQLIYVHAEGEIVFDASGEAIKTYGTIHDITNRKLAELELQQSEEHIRTILSKSPVGMILINDHGLITSFNPMAESMFGYAATEVIGRNVSILMPKPFSNTHDDHIRAHNQTGMGRIIGIGARELLGLRKDGSEFPIELAVSEMTLLNQRSYIGTVLDISEIRQAKARLQQSQKMEAVGQLTGGIAHDFNNLLGSMMLNMELLEEHLKGDPQGQELLSSIANAVNGGAALSRRLLSFSRQHVAKTELVNINEIAQNLDGLLSRAISEKITLNKSLEPNPWLTRLDPNQLESALLNLSLNARDAMPDGGTLTFASANYIQDDEGPALQQNLDPGEYIRVSISDTGTGMPKSLLARVLEPFFTTKEQGKGTGLGLSMVNDFVRQSGGAFNILSKEDTGTTVDMFFPRARP